MAMARQSARREDRAARGSHRARQRLAKRKALVVMRGGLRSWLLESWEGSAKEGGQWPGCTGRWGSALVLLMCRAAMGSQEAERVCSRSSDEVVECDKGGVQGGCATMGGGHEDARGGVGLLCTVVKEGIS